MLSTLGMEGESFSLSLIFLALARNYTVLFELLKPEFFSLR